MHEYKKRLPNLDSLITFDAVARHQSFTLAADELCLTQPAVSQRIKLLEQEMGVQFFERFHKSIQLTQQGNEFHNSVVIALNHLVAASETVKSTSKKPKVRITTDIAMSGCWFGPRIAKLQKHFHDTEIELISTDEPDSYLDPSTDIAIIHGQGEWPGYKVALLFLEEVIPVCSPSFLLQHGPIENVEDIAKANLIDLMYEKWTWMNWTIWLSESGAPYSGINRVFRSNLYDATIQAAKDGIGIALGWRHFIDPELLNQSLVQPISESIKTENGYYLLTRESGPNASQTNAISAWIETEIKNQDLF